MKLISFYTKDTIYEKEVEDLAHSCKALGIDSYIEPKKDLGSWERNCNQKPFFIYECLERFNQPVLWVDADGIALKKPALELSNADLALYFNDRQTFHARNATIYAAPTQSAKQFLLLWDRTLERINNGYGGADRIPDQPVMISLLKEGKIPLHIGELPLEYMQIFDRDPFSIEKTVILHFQASRTAKIPPLFWKNLSGRDLKEMRMSVSQNRVD